MKNHAKCGACREPIRRGSAKKKGKDRPPRNSDSIAKCDVNYKVEEEK